MFGKGAIIIVLGFMAAFSVYQLKLGRTMSSSTDNFNQQYSRVQIERTSLSAMNYAINETWISQRYDTSYNIIANACSAQATVARIGGDTVLIRSRAWNTVFDENEFAASGNGRTLRDSIVAFFTFFTPGSRYFWFTGVEGNVYWTTGDTVFGPVHTNGVLRTFGSPVFQSDVTAFLGIDPPPDDVANLAEYNGNWEVGVQATIPTDMSNLLTQATAGNGGAAINTKALYDTLTTFEFLPTGEVIRTVAGLLPDTAIVNLIAPTGVIHSTADVRVKGTFNGQLTIYSENNIWIDDNLIYADDPAINPLSDDILGLVANQDVVVTDNAPNSTDVDIQASLMTINGSFRAENYDTRVVGGDLSVTGSIVQQIRGPIGTFDWGTATTLSGFNKDYRFDNRLNSITPPHYPNIQNLRLLSWWE